MRRFPVLLIAGLAGLAVHPAPAAKAPPQVTIYRCTDAQGRLALRDSPCRAGERQQVRSMLRPTDPPPRTVVLARRERAAPSPGVPRVVYRTAPRPVFECITPDGERYTSASPEGRPRWVPVWTYGVATPLYGPGVDAGYGASIEHRSGGTVIRMDAGRRWQGPVVGSPVVAAVPVGTWVRDACSPVPAAEACDLLRDRREALDRRWFSALQGDREAIGREQRAIDAEVAESCS